MRAAGQMELISLFLKRTLTHFTPGEFSVAGQSSQGVLVIRNTLLSFHGKNGLGAHGVASHSLHLDKKAQNDGYNFIIFGILNQEPEGSMSNSNVGQVVFLSWLFFDHTCFF